jgi:hypothetical protein
MSLEQRAQTTDLTVGDEDLESSAKIDKTIDWMDTCSSQHCESSAFLWDLRLE